MCENDTILTARTVHRLELDLQATIGVWWALVVGRSKFNRLLSDLDKRGAELEGCGLHERWQSRS